MKKIAIAALIALSSFGAQASVLTGDTATITFNPGIFTANFGIGAGIDFTANNFMMDLDAGVNGNEYIFTSLPQAGSFAGSTSFTLSGLDFTDSSVLTGFSLISTSLTNFSFSTTANSITFFYTDTAGGPGVVIDGLFVTAPRQGAVPLPGTLPLALLGLGALGLGLRARRRGAAQ